MAIKNVIDRARQEAPFAPPDNPFPDLRLVCKILDPIAWNRVELERSLGVKIPPALAELWDSCGGLSLYEDSKFRQWGLSVPSPQDPDLITLNREYRDDNADQMKFGDLVFGRFWGDRERPLIRSDEGTSDYGRIMIVAEMDLRNDWYVAAPTLEEFLVDFMNAHGEKYWEAQYQRRLAERAK